MSLIGAIAAIPTIRNSGYRSTAAPCCFRGMKNSPFNGGMPQLIKIARDNY